MTNQPAPGYVPTGVWRVKGDRNTVYLAGTCHIVGADQVPFPSSFYAAFNDAEVVYVEWDSLSFSSRWALARAVPGMVRWAARHASEFNYADGRSLRDELSPDTVQKLQKRFGPNFAKFEKMTPIGLLFWSEFQGEDGSDTGVDDVFTALAHKQFKPVHSLDGGSAVALALPTMDAVLAHYKEQIAKRGADAVVREELLTDDENEEADWRHGDLAAAQKIHSELKDVSGDLYQQLLPDRNRKWMPAIEQALHSKRNAIVLVGAAHLAGDTGLLELLRQQGHHPERLYGIDKP